MDVHPHQMHVHHALGNDHDHPTHHWHLLRMVHILHDLFYVHKNKQIERNFNF